MKRSDMVIKMTDYWLGLFRNEAIEFEDELIPEVKENMSGLLALLEYHGMKPPVEDVCPIIWTTSHKWENEND